MYLIDTDVLSLLRRPERAPAVADWLDGVADRDIWLSAVTVGEIARGIARQDRVDAAFANDLRAWLGRLTQRYGDRILPFDAPAAMIWGDLSARLGHGSADLMIAATALAADLAVVTRNVRHYAPTGVPVIDPATLG